MKLTQLLLFSFLLLPLTLFASSSQIIITKTSKKSNLRNIKHKLDALHIRMFVKKRGSNFFIYSQKFSTDKSAELALQKIRHSFRYAKILQKNKETTKITSKLNKKRYSVSFALGMQSVSGNSASSYMFEAAYIYNKEIFATLAYLKNSSSDISTSNIYSSLNYNFPMSADSGVYAGGLLGYSKLSKSGFSQSASVLFGTQVGYKYALYNYLDLYTAYQVIYLNHIIKLQNNKELNFTFIHNLEFGISYKF